MPDPKSNLSIFNFKETQLRFLLRAGLFFLPVVLLFIIIELLVLNIPASYINRSAYFETEKDSIEIAVFGSSQVDTGLNPVYFDQPSISFASKSQHHDLDNAIFTQTLHKMPKLKTVVFELSYAHLEIPHNGADFWKNNVYLKYFEVNAFNRATYFKDKLIYISSPRLFSKQLTDYYIKKKDFSGFNKYGYDSLNYGFIFKNLNYNQDAIDQLPIELSGMENLRVFDYNVPYFLSMIENVLNENLQVVICTMPLEKNYLKTREPSVLIRRDSILDLIGKRYAGVKIFRKEEDTLNYNPTDFRNHNHLNPQGAEKFTKELNEFLKASF
ncbi:MAG: hypothetical protein ACJA1Z_000879 [Patiriisocius sp.]|jgi:hypothetical protein